MDLIYFINSNTSNIDAIAIYFKTAKTITKLGKRLKLTVHLRRFFPNIFIQYLKAQELQLLEINTHPYIYRVQDKNTTHFISFKDHN